jgi:hypothetical protein
VGTFTREMPGIRRLYFKNGGRFLKVIGVPVPLQNDK